MTFLRGLAGGVPSGECELCLVCRAGRIGLAMDVEGRAALRDREAHDRARVDERYMSNVTLFLSEP